MWLQRLCSVPRRHKDGTVTDDDLLSSAEALDAEFRLGLLHAMALNSAERARLIHRLWEERDTRIVAELLIDLESDANLRDRVQKVIVVMASGSDRT